LKQANSNTQAAAKQVTSVANRLFNTRVRFRWRKRPKRMNVRPDSGRKFITRLAAQCEYTIYLFFPFYFVGTHYFHSFRSLNKKRFRPELVFFVRNFFKNFQNF